MSNMYVTESLAGQRKTAAEAGARTYLRRHAMPAGDETAGPAKAHSGLRWRSLRLVLSH